jgi:hypothetical protein
LRDGKDSLFRLESWKQLPPLQYLECILPILSIMLYR